MIGLGRSPFRIFVGRACSNGHRKLQLNPIGREAQWHAEPTFHFQGGRRLATKLWRCHIRSRSFTPRGSRCASHRSSKTQCLRPQEVRPCCETGQNLRRRGWFVQACSGWPTARHTSRQFALSYLNLCDHVRRAASSSSGRRRLHGKKKHPLRGALAASSDVVGWLVGSDQKFSQVIDS